MPSRKKNVNHYLAMWDMLGLECIYDVSKAKDEIDQWEKEAIWSTLKEQLHTKRPKPIPLNMMIMRAKFNTQRSYEIYEFNSSMSENELRKEFARDPQPLVDWIRNNGYKVYSDYEKHQRKMIV